MRPSYYSVMTITSPVREGIFRELVNRFGDHAYRDANGIVHVEMNFHASGRPEWEFDGICKMHGLTYHKSYTGKES